MPLEIFAHGTTIRLALDRLATMAPLLQSGELTMPGRRLPPEILAYLGPCREPETLAEKVVEQCQLAKFTGDAGLTDYDPLVVVMHLVTAEVIGVCRSFKKKTARNAWCEALRAAAMA